MKEKFLKLKDDDELENFEEEILSEKRNDLYHEILSDEDMKNHLLKILNVSEDIIKNVLMIDGYPPIDDFNEDEI